MRIISFKMIREFIEREPASRTALTLWFKKAEKASWNNFSEMKRTFNSVDSVGNSRYVFNIAGNRYRIVAKVLFQVKMVFIRFCGSHKEYSKIGEIDKI